MSQFRTRDEYEKAMMDIIDRLTYNRMKWQVWQDLITMMACSISNAVDKTPERVQRREKEYMECQERIGGVDLPARFFALIVEAMEKNPDQDLLGSLYMRLELGSHWHGQFFTPYDLCRAMCDITIDDTVMSKVEEQGWISLNDPACGAGATLVAAANELHRRGINYQTQALFVGQDIDRVVGMMCYIQLSLLGCPGYVVIADTLTNPVVGNVLMPVEKENQEFWYTPFFFRSEWHIRRQSLLFKRIFESLHEVEKPIKKDAYTFFFDFEGDEYNEQIGECDCKAE